MEQFDRLNRLTNDLLLLARFEGKPISSTSAIVDVGNLLRGLSEFFDVVAQDREICLVPVLASEARATG
jgi:signal transduction histidine kinase